MDKWNATKVLLALIVTCCCLSTCSALIDCYGCIGTITDNCGKLTNKATVDRLVNNTYCKITNNGHMITRSGVISAVALEYPEYCSDDSQTGGRACYCNTTSLCNDEIALTVPTISCYVCLSLPFIDTGCGNGDYWKPTSPFVHKETDCIACSKSEDYQSITRGCIKSVHTLEGCHRGDAGIICECTGADCNHAPSLLPAYTAIVISVIWKIFI